MMLGTSTSVVHFLHVHEANMSKLASVAKISWKLSCFPVMYRPMTVLVHFSVDSLVAILSRICSLFKWVWVNMHDRVSAAG